MGQKLHRRRRSYRRRSSPVLKQVIGWVLAAVIIIPGSFFAAKWLFGNKADLPTSQPDAGGATTAQTTVVTTTAPQTVTEQTVLRGFSLPYTALKDVKTLKETAKKAADAGFNCVVIELKNKDGNLLYISETETGKLAAAATADAISLSALTDAFAALRETGVSPVPLLYAFEDPIASRNIPNAKVTVTGHADWTWYDGDPQNGGRAWLNPYTDAAQAYITALSEELQTAGAGAIMLDGVYFPTQTLQANFTAAAGDAASLSKGEVLTRFMARMDTLCDVPVLLRCNTNAALGNNTVGYHTSPLNLGAAMVVSDARVDTLGKKLAVADGMTAVSADAMPSLVGAITDTLAARLQAQTAENRPATALLLDGDNVAAQLTALRTKNKDASYFVFSANGSYAFDALAAK